MDKATREKRLAALWSIISAVLLVSLKTFLTLVTGSLGILSEALHSILDLVAAVITYLSVRVADKPADEDHQFGHGKVESLSAFVETALLLVTAVYIIGEAFDRLLFRHVHIRPSLMAILILLIAAGIDVLRSRALARVAKKHPSEALEADALHFSTDVWSTLTVVVGITATWLGQKYGIGWLSYTDSIAALGVAGVILWIGSRLGKRTLDALLDVAPSGLQQRITRAVSQLDGVLSAERVRVRRSGQKHFVDVTISVPRTASLEQAHATSEVVEKRIAQIVPSDVTVHIEPRAPSGENLFERVRAIAQRRGLSIHELFANQVDGNLFIELHLEVDERASLSDAHRLATELENDIRAETDAHAQVNIHIEPFGVEIPNAEEMSGLSRAIQDFINNQLRPEYPRIVNCHDVNVRNAQHRILVSCHCAMAGNLPVSEVHDIIAAVEDRVKEHFPHVSRVTIHPEPVEES